MFIFADEEPTLYVAKLPEMKLVVKVYKRKETREFAAALAKRNAIGCQGILHAAKTACLVFDDNTATSIEKQVRDELICSLLVRDFPLA